MSYLTEEILLAGCLFLGMLLLFEVGRRLGMARRRRDPDGVGQGSGPVEAAILGLLGLLLAFTFSGAASRFEARRHLITEEANAIGTAYLRLDMLPNPKQERIRSLFLKYLDIRSQVYRNAGDAAATEAKLAEGAALQGEIWQRSVAACKDADAAPQAAIILLPALNAMIDITTTRATAMRNHPPGVVFFLLAVMCLASALLVGYVMCATSVRSWFYMLLFALTMSVTFFVIRDLEYPRYGLIRIDDADKVLDDLRNQMR